MTDPRKETLQTILVVDDHESVLKAVVAVLEIQSSGSFPQIIQMELSSSR